MPATTTLGTINSTPVSISIASDTAGTVTITPVPVEGETIEQFQARSNALYAFLTPKATINTTAATSGVITYRMFSEDEYKEWVTDAWVVDGQRFLADLKTQVAFVTA